MAPRRPHLSDVLRLPHLPGVPDVFHRVRVPSNLDGVTTTAAEEDPRAAGLDRKTVEHIWEGAVDLYRSGVHPGLQLCVRRNGKVVLDRAIGHARGNGPDDPEDAPKVPMTTEIPACIFSASKAVTAMVIHLLDERRQLHIGDRVSEYIPEYAQNGKEGTTIAHVLAHRAGVASMPKEALDLDSIDDWDRIVRLICEEKPSIRPGRMLAYHAVSGGYILGEIVRRVTGKTIREVLAEEILDPLGFRWGNYGVAPADVERVAPAYVTGPPLLPPLSTLVKRVLGSPLDQVVELSNDPRFLTALVPSANVVTTANELSRFFEIFREGGELDGVRVMEPRTIRRALTEQSHLEIDFSLVFPTRFSYGLMLGADYVSLYGRDTDLAFGHLGLINIMGWADPERAISVGLITTGKAIVYPELPRFYWVMQRIASEVPKTGKPTWLEG
ncbi:MAG TPA: serine hydrolase domain-containing protein [Solirubrobacterales bacterium]|nr:serine hydrolase domain-containing protein [Solirubrobacterales bacterium]